MMGFTRPGALNPAEPRASIYFHNQYIFVLLKIIYNDDLITHITSMCCLTDLPIAASVVAGTFYKAYDFKRIDIPVNSCCSYT